MTRGAFPAGGKAETVTPGLAPLAETDAVAVTASESAPATRAMNTSLTITVHYTSESLVNEYSLSSRTKIFFKITYNRYRYNVANL